MKEESSARVRVVGNSVRETKPDWWKRWRGREIEGREATK